jgi:hypothetical protein
MRTNIFIIICLLILTSCLDNNEDSCLIFKPISRYLDSIKIADKINKKLEVIKLLGSDTIYKSTNINKNNKNQNEELDILVRLNNLATHFFLKTNDRDFIHCMQNANLDIDKSRLSKSDSTVIGYHRIKFVIKKKKIFGSRKDTLCLIFNKEYKIEIDR